LLNAINRVHTKTLSANERKAFLPLQNKLSYDARHIAEVQKIDHQREHFASLSLNMIRWQNPSGFLTSLFTKIIVR